MADDPKIVELPQADKLQGALEQLKRSMPQLIEYHVLTAEIKRAYFMALRTKGFTPEQALELTKVNLVGNG
jgi:hypothetical protein